MEGVFIRLRELDNTDRVILQPSDVEEVRRVALDERTIRFCLTDCLFVVYEDEPMKAIGLHFMFKQERIQWIEYDLSTGAVQYQAQLGSSYYKDGTFSILNNGSVPVTDIQQVAAASFLLIRQIFHYMIQRPSSVAVRTVTSAMQLPKVRTKQVRVSVRRYNVYTNRVERRLVDRHTEAWSPDTVWVCSSAGERVSRVKPNHQPEML
ncbi:hypothetical protein ACE1TF_06970 [Geomicrobium sp. JSM 1781026]|uniref:hypothetical protein n=1 Tax=Geomicrobium sp. JSM 1781026 TaxID=3344580 RepID=UPI0035C1DE3A